MNRLTRLLAPLARRERDVRDTLWLLLAAAWILMPHLPVLPLWTSAAAVGLLAWRTAITWRGWRLPSNWLLGLLMASSGVAVYLQFRTIFGKDAGVAYLVLLLGLKMLEMRARRDIFVVTFLCLFILLTSFFESQSIATGGHMLGALFLLVVAMISTHHGEREPTYGARCKIAAQLCALAVPLMAVLFVLFPRVQGPLWGMPADAFSGMTGLSDSMAPGSIASLSQSSEIAFRVQFDGPLPPQSARYWRGPVLNSFGGRAWRPGPLRGAPLVAPADIVPEPASLLRYNVTLEPNNQPWLFTLEAPAAAPQIAGVTTLVRPDLQVVAQNFIRERLRYEASSHLVFRYGQNENRAVLRDSLFLPAGYNPRTLDYARQLRTRLAADLPVDQRATGLLLVNAVLELFRRESFFYTLQPPLLGRDSIDEFLFDTRRGFCEHYASAFAVLMRAMGIPARVVTGYQGGEMNPVDGFLEIRQRDAHAWTEVWFADSGWLRVDPTAAVAPVRVEQGFAQALAPAGIANQLIANNNWLRYARFNWDAITNTWNQWVLSFNGDRQRGLFEGWGLGPFDWQKLLSVLIGVFALVLAGIGLSLLPRGTKTDPVHALYSKYCARNARRGLGRGSAEGPREYLARIAGKLSADRLVQARIITELYEQLRYAPPQSRSGDAFARFKTCVHAWRA